MQRIAPFILTSACLLLSNSCSSFSTIKGSVQDGRVAGQLYYLPQGKIRITGEWKTPPTSVVTVAKDPSKPSFSQADTTPFALFVVTISSEIEADPSARYYLKPQTNMFYSDASQISVNSKGLLSSGNATSEDNTQAIIGTLAAMAAQGLQFAASGGINIASVKVEPGKENFRERLKPFNVVFAPEDWAKYRGRLRSCGFKLEVIKQNVDGVQLSPPKWNPKNTAINGIVFRPTTPWRVNVTSAINGDLMVTEIRESKLLLLPDKEHPLVFDYSRAPFVKKVTNVTFADGVPQDHTRNLPSQALGFLGIPKAILDALVPLPLQLKQTQINNLQADQNLRKLQ